MRSKATQREALLRTSEGTQKPAQVQLPRVRGGVASAPAESESTESEADMRVLLFQDRFVPKILDGSKVHTIRKTARCVPGDVLSLRRWTGRPRWSKQQEFARCECTRVLPLTIRSHSIHIGRRSVGCDRVARADGFVGFEEMRQWFLATHGLPFAGWLIEWGKE